MVGVIVEPLPSDEASLRNDAVRFFSPTTDEDSRRFLALWAAIDGVDGVSTDVDVDGLMW